MSQVSGAACKLNNDKGEWHVSSTPGSVTIQKAYGDLAVECQKASLGKGVRIYSSSANSGVFGNILVGGLIGFAVDAGSGSGFDYPQLMSVDICDGQTRIDADQKTVSPQQWLPIATSFAKNVGCSTSATGTVMTHWGTERYHFACSKRETLYMECVHGGCKEISPFQ